MQSTWTHERIEQLRTLIAENKSGSQIAGIMGLTRNMVCGKAWRLGLHLNGRNQAGRKSYGGRPYMGGRKQKLTALIQRKPRLRTLTERIREEMKDEALAAPNSLNLTFAEVGANQCRFVTTADHPMLFCGLPQEPSSKYCAHHHVTCHTTARWPSRPMRVFRLVDLHARAA